MAVQHYSWRGMSIGEIQSALDDAKAKGDVAAARSARGALYRRGVRVGRQPSAVQREKPAAEFGMGIRDRVARIIAAADVLVMEVGVQSDDGKTQKEAIESAAATPKGETPNLATVAALHEFGTVDQGGNIPQRSFLRSTGDRIRKPMVRGLAKVLQEYGDGDEGAAVTRLVALGVQGRDAVQATIRGGIKPALADSTKTKARTGGGDREPIPLVYTGQLIGSIRSEATTPAGRVDLGGYNRTGGS